MKTLDPKTEALAGCIYSLRRNFPGLFDPFNSEVNGADLVEWLSGEGDYWIAALRAVGIDPNNDEFDGSGRQDPMEDES